MNILFTGHSHLTALTRGTELRTHVAGANRHIFGRLDNSLVNPREIKEAGGWEKARNAAAQDLRAVLSSAEFDTVVSCIGGNVHSLFGLTNAPNPFDFVIPEHADLTMLPNAEVVPYAAIRKQLETRMLPHIDLMLLLSQITEKRILHLSPPPPIESEAHIRANPSKFAERIQELGVAPPILRWKFWRASIAILETVCQKKGIEFLPVPRAAVTSTGFLAPEFWHEDPVHGNARFGALVLDYVDQHLSEPGK